MACDKVAEFMRNLYKYAPDNTHPMVKSLAKEAFDAWNSLDDEGKKECMKLNKALFLLPTDGEIDDDILKTAKEHSKELEDSYKKQEACDKITEFKKSHHLIFKEITDPIDIKNAMWSMRYLAKEAFDAWHGLEDEDKKQCMGIDDDTLNKLKEQTKELVDGYKKSLYNYPVDKACGKALLRSFVNVKEKREAFDAWNSLDDDGKERCMLANKVQSDSSEDTFEVITREELEEAKKKVKDLEIQFMKALNKKKKELKREAKSEKNKRSQRKLNKLTKIEEAKPKKIEEAKPKKIESTEETDEIEEAKPKKIEQTEEPQTSQSFDLLISSAILIMFMIM